MTEPQLNDTDGTSRNPRTDLVREASILQLKLLADGLRDALLIPLSLVAALIGLARGGPDCDREFRRVIKLGLRSERWINLFGHHKPLGRSGPAGSMDSIIEQVESTVLDQYRRGRKATEAETPAQPEDRP
ncbi:MAG: hypothetical protein EHM68_11175 [Lysobacterales bacterium]|nr:MAG: hypothetical protein EHM68_11175 [Xanthomonadales bacterium]